MEQEAILTPQGEKTGRNETLDFLRGLALLIMICYHALWDFVYLLDYAIPWYRGPMGLFWQVTSCSLFILLSGFCWSFGKRPVFRGAVVFGCGLLIFGVTALTMPENTVRIGILTFLGSAMVLLVLIAPLLRKISPPLGLFVSLGLFLLFWNLGSGSVGLLHWEFFQVPPELYRGPVGAFLGFPPAGFVSADYFPLFPWFFLYCCGFFLYRVGTRAGEVPLPSYSLPYSGPLVFLGRHSLVVYLLHQPILYGLIQLFPT